MLTRINPFSGGTGWGHPESDSNSGRSVSFMYSSSLMHGCPLEGKKKDMYNKINMYTYLNVYVCTYMDAYIYIYTLEHIYALKCVYICIL